MKALKSKSEERREIAHQVEHFLQRGGQVHSVAPGTSARNPGETEFSRTPFEKGRQSRTPVLEQVQAVESRRRPKATSRRRSLGPRRVLVTDDFGEPLRWRWQD